MKLNAKKIITLCSVIVIILALLAGNIVAYLYRDVITTAFGGYGLRTENIDFTKGSKVCEEIEAEGIVLLENRNNTLPLQDVTKVNVFGWSSIEPAYSGGGSGASQAVTLAKTFYQALTDENIAYNQDLYNAYKNFKAGREEGDYWNESYPYLNLIEPSLATLEQSVTMEAARAYSDTAIIFITRLGGEVQDLPRTQVKWNATEDTSRTYLDVTTEEEALINAVKEQNYENVVVIVNSINAMNTSFLDDEGIDAALSVGSVGQYGMTAVAKTLTGKYSPSGKLVDTYAYDFSTAATYATSPDGHNFNSAKGSPKTYSDTGARYVDYNESIYVGYKWYETADKEGFWASDYAKNKWNVNGYDDVVQYPFGYGLSLTEFAWTLKEVSIADNSTIYEDSVITMEIEVENIGEANGADVVQIYYEPEYKDGIEKASKNLIAFAKTQELAPTEKQLLTLSFKASDMASYDCYDANENGFEGYELESGEYKVYISTTAHDVKEMDNNTLNYTVASDITMREFDGAVVSNHFTGEDASDEGYASDGSNTNQNVTYLSRGDFEGKFPEIDTTRRTQGFTITTTWNDYVDTDETFEQGVDSGLRLYNDGELNVELAKELGSDYDHEKWDTLLSQITVNELKAIVMLGGYGTAEIPSIGKPRLVDLDGPQGFNDLVINVFGEAAQFTFFPSETVMAQTWDEGLLYTYGLAVAYEGNTAGVNGWYAPACNIHRSPFGGRNYEYYSEDAFISGKMAAQTIRGAKNNGVYSYLKHFAVNEVASGGLYTWVTEQAMREIYFKSFEIAVKEGGTNAVMTSMTQIGATWCSGSYALITEVLRNEWGFKGTVITDAWVGSSLVNMSLGLRAGTDLLLNSANTETAYSQVKWNDTTSLACARNAAHNILYTLCDTINTQSEYLAAIERGENPDGDLFTAELTGKGSDGVFAWWVILLVVLDVLAVAGCGIWLYMSFFRKEKESKAK